MTRLRQFIRYVRAFFVDRTQWYTCDAKLKDHRCGRPLGHLGKHWCQCWIGDGEEWE